ncbi:hypothetical protein [Actinomadura roseirufa]|uniref:hypothetical protein n=1 Tax=Actinomadura roseirufa TaxID=2094049 RepID=UPI001041159C|nr:hypothetical protein [Actinomadura roseirufa]
MTQKYGFHGVTPPTETTNLFRGPDVGPLRIFYPSDPPEIIKPCFEEPSSVIKTELQAELGTSDPAKGSYISLSDLLDSSRTLHAYPGGTINVSFVVKKCPL